MHDQNYNAMCFTFVFLKTNCMLNINSNNCEQIITRKNNRNLQKLVGLCFLNGLLH